MLTLFPESGLTIFKTVVPSPFKPLIKFTVLGETETTDAEPVSASKLKLPSPGIVALFNELVNRASVSNALVELSTVRRRFSVPSNEAVILFAPTAKSIAEFIPPTVPSVRVATYTLPS